jgi:hypothetical protein
VILFIDNGALLVIHCEIYVYCFVHFFCNAHSIKPPSLTLTRLLRFHTLALVRVTVCMSLFSIIGTLLMTGCKEPEFCSYLLELFPVLAPP